MKNNPLQYRTYIVIFKINLRSLLRKADFCVKTRQFI